MLIRFSVENFCSLKDEQELSLVASNLEEPIGKAVPVLGGKTNLLSVTALYGGNASGKTNLFDAFGFFLRAILHSHTRWEGRKGVPGVPFRFDTVSKKKPSKFEVDIILENVRYQYGLSMDRKIILEETLYAYPMGKRQLWFDRKVNRNPKFKFGKNLSGRNLTIQKLTRPNSLFLSSAAQNNHYQLSPIYEWFKNLVNYIPDDRRSIKDTVGKIVKGEVSASGVLEFLKLADLGISDIKILEENKKAKEDIADFRNGLATLLKEHVSIEVGEEFEANDEIFKTVELFHYGKREKPFSLDFFKESHGTQTLFSLIGPILYALRTGGLLLVDELEKGMHPLLARQLVKLFNSESSNPKNAQLIFTTHSTNLLRDGLLRRDQIWFAEKDRKGVTHIYPLTDFRPRKSENIERGYLQGRYGAVPFLGDADFLIQRKLRNGAKKKAKAS